MAKIKYNRCNRVMNRTDWGKHECKDMRNIKELPFDILRQLAHGKITEKKAWAMADERRAA